MYHIWYEQLIIIFSYSQNWSDDFFSNTCIISSFVFAVVCFFPGGNICIYCLEIYLYFASLLVLYVMENIDSNTNPQQTRNKCSSQHTVVCHRGCKNSWRDQCCAFTYFTSITPKNSAPSSKVCLTVRCNNNNKKHQKNVSVLTMLTVWRKWNSQPLNLSPLSYTPYIVR